MDKNLEQAWANGMAAHLELERLRHEEIPALRKQRTIEFNHLHKAYGVPLVEISERAGKHPATITQIIKGNL